MQTTMKKILLSAIIIAAGVMGAAAQTRTAYFMEGTTFRSQFNPAFAPTQGYFNIPVLGGIGLNVDGTLSLNDIFKQGPNGKLVTILSGSVPYNIAVEGLNKDKNSFNLYSKVNIIGFGAYTKNQKNFWSFDINLNFEGAIDVPFSFFDFAKNVQSGNSRYDFAGMQGLVNSYVDIGFNYSMPIMENLYVGARAKFLIGLAHANAKLSRFDLTLNENEWSAAMQAEMNLYMNGLSAPEGCSVDDAFDNMKFNGPSGYGFAIDLGATYDVIENLQVSLAVNDIGFISWKNSGHFVTDEQGMRFSGMDVVVGKDGTTTGGSESFSFDDISLRSVGSGQGRATALRATINAGAEYEMWNHWVGFGLLYHARMGLYKSSHNLTASVNFHPRHWFTFTPSYTFNNNSGGAVGLALNFSPTFINFFLATDILLAKHTPQFIPYKQDRMTFTFGLGVPMGRKGHRVAEYAAMWKQKEQQKYDKAAAKASAKAAKKSNSGTKVSTK